VNAASPEELLAATGFMLPAAPGPRGHYAPFCIRPLGTQRLVCVSGQTCRVDGHAIAGICDADGEIEQARHAARIAMLNVLAALRAACGGELSRVAQVMRVRGFIRSTQDFGRHTAVLDAASELLRMAFPLQPLPARTVVGASSLPDEAWIEIELDAVCDGFG
jgi:enamine deaminase RidA (YjgF/YER057c/UK114 family)